MKRWQKKFFFSEKELEIWFKNIVDLRKSAKVRFFPWSFDKWMYKE